MLALLGRFLVLVRRIYIKYITQQTISSFAEFGKNSRIGYPFQIKGTNKYTPRIKYIHIGEGVNLGAGVTIFATRAHVFIGKRSFSGPNLTIMTGDHPSDILGRFIADNKKADLERNGVDISKYDKKVVIDEDVWMGSNVTILKGVHIGRGAIIAAGSIVTHSLPAYCVAGGVPAKVLRFRWSIEDTMKHEELLYPEGQRLSHEELEEQIKSPQNRGYIHNHE